MFHIKSPFRSEPDYSGYSDEYGFTPLPPRLESTLEEMISEGSFDSIKEATELEDMGYISDLNVYFRNKVSYDITQRGKTYAADKAAYLERREAWERRNQKNERGQFIREILIAAISAAISSIVTMLVTK